MDKRFAAAVAAITAAVHVATSWRYGYYRDELYFIACAKRLAWGYVDMPPLTAFIAWLSAPAHYQIVALRFAVAIAAGLTVYIACALTAEFGGGLFAQCMAAATVALTPAYLFLGNTLTTTSFEPFTWSLTIYATVRLVRLGDRRWWYAIAGAVAFGLYGKYSILLLVAALLTGLLCTPERRILKSPLFPLASAAVIVLLAPNIAWQSAAGWPILEVLRGDVLGRHAFNSGWQFEYRQPLANAGAFLAEQALFTNPIAAPIWIAGIVAVFRNTGIRNTRFIAIGFLVLIVLAVALNAKGYYIAGIYAALFCAGWAALERMRRIGWGTVVAAAVMASGILLAPFTLPVLSIQNLVSYSIAAGITGRNGSPARLVQPLFADEFGWDALTRRVATIYRALPPAQRRATAIFSDTYGGAAALEFYGRRYGLPKPISAQNSYYLWGTGGYDGRSLLAIGASQAELLRANFRNVVLVATFSDPYRWAAEGPTPIFLCTHPVAPLRQLWPHFKWYGA